MPAKCVKCDMDYKLDENGECGMYYNESRSSSSWSAIYNYVYMIKVWENCEGSMYVEWESHDKQSLTVIPKRRPTLASFPGSPSAFPSGGSKVIRGIIARKEREPGNEANQLSDSI